VNAENEQRLLTTLELIENDLETTTLAMLAIMPPLITIAFQNDPRKSQEMIKQIASLGEVHGDAAADIRNRALERLQEAEKSY